MWQVYFTNHFVGRYAERLQFVDFGPLAEMQEHGRLFTNDSLARELARAGNFYANPRGNYICLINGLKAYVVELRPETKKCVAITALPLSNKKLAEIRNMERVNVPNLGKQNTSARTLENLVAV